ncbi:hypothetical protein UCD39_07335 [Nitrospirillum sp. BR 11752]|uniref:thermonuclease family protein n=1 Tax=Nitrospirillum sp. BR 11752 TaxID=3104293 RepID=UPI002EAD6C1F|nr:hypothetical protein [Nitrospirillum sp. BR 11752]
MVLAVLAGGTALAAPPPPVGGGGDVIEGHAQATEGDTLLVDGGEIKLYGIDAPDPGQTCQNRRGASYDCFAQATKELQAIVQDKIVRCTTKESPPKQRRLGVCTVGGGTSPASWCVPAGPWPTPPCRRTITVSRCWP